MCDCTCHTDPENAECTCTTACIRGEPEPAPPEYTAGRIAYEGTRVLRYEAGWDICLATVRILREYASDCESAYFACIHEDDLNQVKQLVSDFEVLDKRVDMGEAPNELQELKLWLHRVADLLPGLWD